MAAPAAPAAPAARAALGSEEGCHHPAPNVPPTHPPTHHHAVSPLALASPSHAKPSRSSGSRGGGSRQTTATTSTTSTTRKKKQPVVDTCPPIVVERPRKSSRSSARRYAKGRPLGKGGFATVHVLTDLATGEAFAGKVISKRRLTRPRAQAKLLAEIRIHRQLAHGHIVRFRRCFEDADNVYILLELCEGQTLAELLRSRGALTEAEVGEHVFQLASALAHLHANNIVHRDLKLGNVFIAARGELRLGDFGLACRLQTREERKQTVCGTPNYIAPVREHPARLARAPPHHHHTHTHQRDRLRTRR